MNLYTPLEDNLIRCDVCPRLCALKPGQIGYCRARENTGDKVEMRAYGHIAGLAVDPVEKKPLNRFLPGSTALSFGTYGCNMGCMFCQNWHLTKTDKDPYELPYATPGQIVKVAQNYKCESIAFTYNDPVVFIEYAVDVADAVHSAGLKTVAVSAGYINPDARSLLFSRMDAANIDLKAFSREFYKKNCCADIDVVLDTILYIKNETNCHLELTTLLIEGENDTPDEIERECVWIVKNLGTDVPVHFSAFHPAYKFMDKNCTPLYILYRARDIAKKAGIKYIYLGNI